MKYIAEVINLIRFKLKEILDQKEKTMYWVSKNANVRPNTISQWVNNEKVKSINVDSLNNVCKALDCKLEDIVEYVPDKEKDQ